ncbi:hypothetical protein D5018_15480 [Parashewanella curva]|uniref:Calcineurin-like phosphoesterase domain-containing protein n=1 Tax=Parashewanella curva TaxID=2338552 RepID=A0A3L8PTS1_9GAMM|nr:metallophosphoesterase [Parashewanella curva]RLV58800.1 hypothetical protein D5018_15480 [Parashewanella curva]
MYSKLLATTLLFSASALSSTIDFVVFGDTPYSKHEQTLLKQPDGKFAQLLTQVKHDFIVHIGDIKAGAQPCTNELLQTNFQLISQVSPKPFVYTPGDNEWTDCDRPSLKPSYDELERLEYVIEHFAQHEVNLPKFQRQTKQKENQVWEFDGVKFITLHVAGTNNGRDNILNSDVSKARRLTDRRDENNFEWLNQQLPQQQKAAVVFMQADIYQKPASRNACIAENNQSCDGFKAYREKLNQLATSLDYPLMLAHGDTGEFCFSQRKSGLWHFNAPGDYRIIDMALVSIDTKNASHFSIKPLLSSQPIDSCAE